MSSLRARANGPPKPSAPLPATATLAVVRRGADAGTPHMESWHAGALVIVQGERVLRSLGDVEQMVWCRSALKPLQALPLLELGVHERLALSGAEIAVISASHSGTPEHTATVESLLRKGGLAPEQLQCGPHAPFDAAAARALMASGARPERIHNNCSGKHAGFLLLARAVGVAPEKYLEPGSDGQVLVRRAIAEMADQDPAALEPTLDGCGAPTYRLPLVALARAFARLANPDGLSPVRAAACRTLLQAVGNHPRHLSGPGRFDTALAGSAPRRILPKGGAEGVHAIGWSASGAAAPAQGIGIAVKVADGNERGYQPLLVEVLRGLGLWPEVPPELADFHRIPVRNTQRIVTGHVTAAVAWADEW